MSTRSMSTRVISGVTQGRRGLAQALAGLIGGLLMAVGMMALLGALFHADAQGKSAAAQMLRWLPGPVWGLAIAFSFLFRNPARAWSVWLGAAAVLWAGYALSRGLT